MDQVPPPLNKKGFSKKYKNLIIISLAIIIVVVILVSPVIPIQYIVIETRTRNLQYSSQLYTKTFNGMNLGKYFVNVTNEDSIGGSFSVTMNYWVLTNIFTGEKRLEDTSSQSLSINAGATQAFYAPSDWIIIPQLPYSFTYSVSAPITQEAYNVTKTEYKSILNLIGEKL